MGVSMLQIDLLSSAISGALVVLFGAGYALLFAFSQLKKLDRRKNAIYINNIYSGFKFPKVS
ncbi:hypothetical protein OAN54_02280 [Gammaproteobacteria bacterium]|nr:hypothetical protein [Gammaproteobacteria bacterium]